MSAGLDTEPKLAATVVVVRDAAEGLQCLLLERMRKGGVASGAWVFPGGKIEASDFPAGSDDVEVGARRAAVREVQEESGLALDDSTLIPISRWITPPISPKRFDTWFFLAAVDRGGVVRVDGGEIRSHRWMAPGEALEAHHRREIPLAPPTFVTIHWLTAYADAAAATAALANETSLTFRPRLCALPQGACMLYPGDAGYDDGDAERSGPRHRLWTHPDGWRYERSTSS